MESFNGIPIDGKTEIDDLALVMHIAQSENERLKELESLGKPYIGKPARPHDSDHESDSDDSEDEFETVYRELREKYYSDLMAEKEQDKNALPPVDPNVPIDNIRIIDTVDLPTRVADHFPIGRVGTCISVVGKVVVVQCTEPSKILDLGSIVCLGDRRIIGTVSDTFGNTGSPFHMVISNDPEMVTPGDEIYYDVKHSTLVSDLNVAETASSMSSGEDSDFEGNQKKKDTARQPVKLKQYYNDLECY